MENQKTEESPSEGQKVEEQPAGDQKSEEQPIGDQKSEEQPIGDQKSEKPTKEGLKLEEPPAEEKKSEEKNSSITETPYLVFSCESISWVIQRNISIINKIVWNKDTHEYDEIKVREEVSYTVIGSATKQFTITNIGLIPAKWQIDHSDPLFSISASSGSLGIGESCMIEVTVQTSMISEDSMSVIDGESLNLSYSAIDI